MRCVVGSTVMVRAPRSVVTVSTASYLPLTALTMVMVPSPLELNARPESKPAPSTPEPMGGVAITFIVAISVTAIILLPHTLNSFFSLTSMARPDGPSHGASDARRERGRARPDAVFRSEEHTSELQSLRH